MKSLSSVHHVQIENRRDWRVSVNSCRADNKPRAGVRGPDAPPGLPPLQASSMVHSELTGRWVLGISHPHTWVQQHTDLLPLWETFLREGGVQGKEGLAAAELLATDTLPTSWWPQGSAPIPEGWAGLLTTEGGIQTVSPTAQSFGHPQHRDRDSETRGPLG